VKHLLVMQWILGVLVVIIGVFVIAVHLHAAGGERYEEFCDVTTARGNLRAQIILPDMASVYILIYLVCSLRYCSISTGPLLLLRL